MNFGTYSNIADLKNVLGITTTTDDVVMRKMLESASRFIDKWCHRHFYVYSGARYFDGEENVLLIDDLLSVTYFKTDEDLDGVYEKTWATSDYILYPRNTYPKLWAELTGYGDYGSFVQDIKNSIEITGLWGYGDGTSATPYIVDTTLSAAITSTTATTFAITSATNLSAGQTILIDSEQMYIYSISSTTLTVERGVNGTTAATHLISAPLYIYQYPSDIRQACMDLGVSLYSTKGKEGIKSETLGDYTYTLFEGTQTSGALKTLLEDKISAYKRVRL